MGTGHVFTYKIPSGFEEIKIIYFMQNPSHNEVNRDFDTIFFIVNLLL